MHKPKTHAGDLAKKMEEVVNKKIWDLQQAKKEISKVINNQTLDFEETFDKLKYFGKKFDDACCDLQDQSDVISFDMVEWFVHEYCEWKGNKPSYIDLWVSGCQSQDERIEYILQNIKDDKNNVVEDEEEEFAGFKDKDFI